MKCRFLKALTFRINNKDRLSGITAKTALNRLCFIYCVSHRFFMSNTVYFQPPGIRPQYCEAGMISETDPEYIWYYDEPCKILISEVIIIPKEQVIYDKKKRQYFVKRDAS